MLVPHFSQVVCELHQYFPALCNSSCDFLFFAQLTLGQQFLSSPVFHGHKATSYHQFLNFIPLLLLYLCFFNGFRQLLPQDRTTGRTSAPKVAPSYSFRQHNCCNYPLFVTKIILVKRIRSEPRYGETLSSLKIFLCLVWPQLPDVN